MGESFLFSCCYAKTRCVIRDSGVMISFNGNSIINPTLELFKSAISLEGFSAEESCKIIFYQLLEFVKESNIPEFRRLLAKYRWYSNMNTSDITQEEFFNKIAEKQNMLYDKFTSDSEDKVCSIYNLINELGKEYLNAKK